MWWCVQHNFYVGCINNAILQLKEEQGWDVVDSNHLKFSGQNIRSYLSIFLLLSWGIIEIFLHKYWKEKNKARIER